MEYGATDVRLFETGTQALQMALTLAIAKVGGPVALPAFSCFDVGAAAVGVGATITLYDVDPGTLSPDIDSLRRTIAAGARVIVIAPLYGYPINWDPIEALVGQTGAIAIEDAAQGDGGFWRGRPIGSFGPMSVLSFGRGKGWTGGSGGALLMRSSATTEPSVAPASGDDRVAEGRRLLAFAVQWAMGRPSLYSIPAALPWLHLGETVYRAPGPIRQMASSVSAGIAATRADARQEAVVRRGNAERLTAALQARSAVCPTGVCYGGVAGYLRLAVRVPGGLEALRDPRRARRLGIMRSYPQILAHLPAVRSRMKMTASRWRGAESLVRSLVTFPTHSLLAAEDFDAVVSQVGLT